jgi:hypothetical protein
MEVAASLVRNLWLWSWSESSQEIDGETNRKLNRRNDESTIILGSDYRVLTLRWQHFPALIVLYAWNFELGGVHHVQIQTSAAAMLISNPPSVLRN